MHKSFESMVNWFETIAASISVTYLLATALLLIVLGSMACSSLSTPKDAPTASPTRATSSVNTAVTIPANVTTEMHNPFPDLAVAAVAGAPFYQANCAFCHGDSGAGDGPAGTSFDPKPTHLAKGKILNDPDGKVFLALKNGKGKMPAMKKMTDEQMWQVVAYVRTLAKQ
jgi:mono/diheme cytochrome c family protein